MDDELQNLSEQVYTSTFNLIEDGNSPLAVAAMRSQVRLLTDFANQKTLN
jgi:hypothetical protein